MQITIGGVPGSGKSTVAKIVAQKLGYEFYSIGAIRRKLATERGLTIDEFNSLPEDTDSMVDEYQKKLGREGDCFVNEGRLAFYFMPNSIKIYFHCELRVAAERIFNDQRSSERKYNSIDEVCNDLLQRMESDKQRFRRYGVNCYDPSHFDYVIDTTNMSIEEVVETVMEICKRHGEKRK